MLGNQDIFRPWGKFHEIIRSQAAETWALLACASMEERCTAIFSSLNALGINGQQLVLEIEDPISNVTPEIELLTGENKKTIQEFGFDNQQFVKLGLNDPFGKFEALIRIFLQEVGEQNLIIDITSLPKKVYFFLTKILFKDRSGPRNVIFTYAEPDRYSDEPLAANPDPWEALPGFRVSPRDETTRSVVVGIGYEPLGLPDLIDSGKFNESQILFLFPFPAQADRVARNWRFIRGIFPNADSNRLSIIRVDGINIPEVYQTLTSLGERGQHGLTLAPFGPKPVSLAMALYAARHSTPGAQTGVYYTQPSYYNPHYSSGMRLIDGLPVINAYCVKISGNFLY